MSGTNTNPEADALRWAIDHAGDFNHVTGEHWTAEENLYLHQLKQMLKQHSRLQNPYRPTS